MEVVDLRESFAAKGATVKAIIQDSCASLRPSSKGSVESFCAGFNKSVSSAFRNESVDAQYHASTTIDGVTSHFSGGVSSEEDRASTKSDDVVEPAGDTEVTELYILLFRLGSN